MNQENLTKLAMAIVAVVTVQESHMFRQSAELVANRDNYYGTRHEREAYRAARTRIAGVFAKCACPPDLSTMELRDTLGLPSDDHTDESGDGISALGQEILLQLGLKGRDD